MLNDKINDQIDDAFTAEDVESINKTLEKTEAMNAFKDALQKAYNQGYADALKGIVGDLGRINSGLGDYITDLNKNIDELDPDYRKFMEMTPEQQAEHLNQLTEEARELEEQIVQN